MSGITRASSLRGAFDDGNLGQRRRARNLGRGNFYYRHGWSNRHFPCPLALYAHDAVICAAGEIPRSPCTCQKYAGAAQRNPAGIGLLVLVVCELRTFGVHSFARGVKRVLQPNPHGCRTASTQKEKTSGHT